MCASSGGGHSIGSSRYRSTTPSTTTSSDSANVFCQLFNMSAIFPAGFCFTYFERDDVDVAVLFVLQEAELATVLLLEVSFDKEALVNAQYNLVKDTKSSFTSLTLPLLLNHHIPSPLNIHDQHSST